MKERPRHYLTAYLKADGDREKEREALAGMPIEFRPLLTTYIGIHKERSNAAKSKQEDKRMHGARF